MCLCVCVLVSLQKYGKYRWIFAFCKTTEYVPSMCYRSYTPLIFSLISFVLLLTVDSFSFYFLCKKIFYYLFILHRRLRVKNAIYFNRHLCHTVVLIVQCSFTFHKSVSWKSFLFSLFPVVLYIRWCACVWRRLLTLLPKCHYRNLFLLFTFKPLKSGFQVW